ncbi:hypothetical protein HOD05_05600 [Candidatus Woesearchaeota archaeon]|jgi:hypothetical protein|nr:hypothetical protein [Candidatus Woesearchaeota archaeon]MBT4150479.1 hypothetical protein [Candidatus Woesearchaeota archaeon]MBT4247119.1 hypothetical protein [Candidatus Woesearchaeota archaeon]MBT4434655.1 hypothetical protein [Candidatus Woesearchaeota archaeon]MBT7332454.1 hypothetical protein [Candidatus Woesearchaeota archaeon]
MKALYHDRVVGIFCDNLDYFKEQIGFPVKKTKTGIYFPKGEIDILLEGFEREQALIEVKSHHGLMGKFLTKQFQAYRGYNPNASIYLLCGTNDLSLNVEDFTLRRYQRGFWCLE